MSPASSVVMGCVGLVSHVEPFTWNLYWTGTSHGTLTETVHTLPEWVIASPMVHAPVR